MRQWLFILNCHWHLSLSYKAKLVEHFMSAKLTFYASQFLIFWPITINMTLICELCKSKPLVCFFGNTTFKCCMFCCFSPYRVCWDKDDSIIVSVKEHIFTTTIQSYLKGQFGDKNIFIERTTVDSTQFNNQKVQKSELTYNS